MVPRNAYGQLFSVQPFGNSPVVKTTTGAQICTLLEQQLNIRANTDAAPRVLLPGRFHDAYNLATAARSRITAKSLGGVPMVDAPAYRVTMNSFLATGRDTFTLLNGSRRCLGRSTSPGCPQRGALARPHAGRCHTHRSSCVDPHSRRNAE